MMDWLAPIVALVLVAGIVTFIICLLNCGQDTDGHNQFDNPDDYLRAVKKATGNTFHGEAGPLDGGDGGNGD